MRIFQIFFWVIWRIWFYVLTAVLTVFFSPVLFILMFNQNWYKTFYWIARNLWATPILYGMGLIPKVHREEKIQAHKSYMLVANHTSMADIMLMLYCSKNPFVFVGKRELAKMPVFGFFYKRFAILVDRSNAESRRMVYDSARKRLDNGLSICIFPEGGVPNPSVTLDTFKDGAFRLAIEHQIPIVPMVFFDNKRLFPFEFFAGKMGVTHATIYPFFETKHLMPIDKSKLKKSVRDLMLNALEKKLCR